MAEQITVAELQAALPTGIVLDTDYAATAPGLLPITNILDAYAAAQTTFNTANTVPGGDITSLLVGVGPEQVVFYPPNQTTTTVTVTPRTYSITVFQRSAVTDVYPTFG
ncbi:hypothetical protein [Microcoleus asticus]|uniref:Uncharacterized protein n=1 Tax=Microcoleus asticus IPMA8 TaxID=2563858 RepID=A0ABX2D7E5_9CYAN|nr:hypothetical protein [Microcoleus asticus]NQE38594.1 hypothetical protein [Microcoleus asticus IPMA8]